MRAYLCPKLSKHPEGDSQQCVFYRNTLKFSSVTNSPYLPRIYWDSGCTKNCCFRLESCGEDKDQSSHCHGGYLFWSPDSKSIKRLLWSMIELKFTECLDLGGWGSGCRAQGWAAGSQQEKGYQSWEVLGRRQVTVTWGSSHVSKFWALDRSGLAEFLEEMNPGWLGCARKGWESQPQKQTRIRSRGILRPQQGVTHSKDSFKYGRDMIIIFKRQFFHFWVGFTSLS